jgi:hypothetical protein
MSSQTNGKPASGRQAEPESQTETPAANAVFHNLIDPAIKVRLFVLVRVCAQGLANAETHKAGLANQAALIPNFAVFRQLCMEDLTEAFHEDRRDHVHVTRNRKRVWLNLFKPFARLNRITQALAITAIDHQGHYLCELTEPRLPDLMGQWLRIGVRLGLSEAHMMALYQRNAHTGRQHDALTHRAQPTAN